MRRRFKRRLNGALTIEQRIFTSPPHPSNIPITTSHSLKTEKVTALQT